MERSAKRVRQACIPCRRKKSRCPGEKPVCSYCARLRQVCSYADENGTVSENGDISSNSRNIAAARLSLPLSEQRNTNPDTATRLAVVENQLSEVLSVLRNQQQHTIQPQSFPSELWDSSSEAEQSQPVTIDSILMREAIELYMTNCHCQPLPLLDPQYLVDSNRPSNRGLIEAIVALSIRFHPRLNRDEQKDLIQQCVSSSSARAMQQISSEVVELQTLQSLCLLFLVEFYESNTQRASIYLSLAVDLCQSAGLSWSCTSSSHSQIHEQQLRCFWSIVMLVRLHANLLGPFSLSVDTTSLTVYPTSLPRPLMQDGLTSTQGEDLQSALEHNDLGIMTYIIHLSEVWQKVAQYARRRRQPETHPPWSTKSEYAKILARQMDRETLMPYSRHRYKPSQFDERTIDEIVKHRHYWGPWFLNQMMYHGIICLLNHPLLLSLRLRTFRVAEISEIWLQHTDDLVTSHTTWIIHLIQLVNAKGFGITDPFLAHIAAIVATIYLQQRFVDDEGIKQIKIDGYSTCVTFVRRIGQHWPHIDDLALKLDELEQMVCDSYQHSASSRSQDKVYIDLTIFWEILESSLISEHQDKHGVKFGSSLKPQYHAVRNTEEVNAHPLPEPSRLQNVSTPTRFDVRPEGGSQLHASTTLLNPDNPGNANDDFAVLAQSYFAQGQDFVGGLDDWWTLSQV